MLLSTLQDGCQQVSERQYDYPCPLDEQTQPSFSTEPAQNAKKIGFLGNISDHTTNEKCNRGRQLGLGPTQQVAYGSYTTHRSPQRVFA